MAATLELPGILHRDSKPEEECTSVVCGSFTGRMSWEQGGYPHAPITPVFGLCLSSEYAKE